jgi:hypothetical protein
MTPLHILSCQGKHDVRLYQCIITKFSDTILIKDNWCKLPIMYALYGEAPLEVIRYFLEEHCQRRDTVPFDFGEMILKLAKKQGTSADYMRGVIHAQRTHFRGLEVDWRQIVDESIECNIPLVMFQVLVEASVSAHSICMNVEHQIEVEIEVDQRIAAITAIAAGDHDANPFELGKLHILYGEIHTCVEQIHYDEIHGLITRYSKLHHKELKEAIVILELALWKAMLSKWMSAMSQDDGVASRMECRNQGGRFIEMVIPHVLSFL